MLSRDHDTYVYHVFQLYLWMISFWYAREPYSRCNFVASIRVDRFHCSLGPFVRLSNCLGINLRLWVVVHSISRPAFLFLLGQYTDGGIRMVSEAVRHLDLHMQHHHSPSHHCRGLCTSPFLLPFSLRLGPSTGPLSCSAHSFGIQGFQHCPSAISCLGPPRHTCGIVPPPGFSSLVDTVTSSLSSFGVSVRPLVLANRCFPLLIVGSKLRAFG